MVINFPLPFLKSTHFGMPQDQMVSALLSKKERNLGFFEGTAKVKIPTLRTLRFEG